MWLNRVVPSNNNNNKNAHTHTDTHTHLYTHDHSEKCSHGNNKPSFFFYISSFGFFSFGFCIIMSVVCRLATENGMPVERKRASKGSGKSSNKNVGATTTSAGALSSQLSFASASDGWKDDSGNMDKKTTNKKTIQDTALLPNTSSSLHSTKSHSRPRFRKINIGGSLPSARSLVVEKIPHRLPHEQDPRRRRRQQQPSSSSRPVHNPNKNTDQDSRPTTHAILANSASGTGRRRSGGAMPTSRQQQQDTPPDDPIDQSVDIQVVPSTRATGAPTTPIPNNHDQVEKQSKSNHHQHNNKRQKTTATTITTTTVQLEANSYPSHTTPNPALPKHSESRSNRSNKRKHKEKQKKRRLVPLSAKKRKSSLGSSQLQDTDEDESDKTANTMEQLGIDGNDGKDDDDDDTVSVEKVLGTGRQSTHGKDQPSRNKPKTLATTRLASATGQRKHAPVGQKQSCQDNMTGKRKTIAVDDGDDEDDDKTTLLTARTTCTISKKPHAPRNDTTLDKDSMHQKRGTPMTATAKGTVDNDEKHKNSNNNYNNKKSNAATTTAVQSKPTPRRRIQKDILKVGDRISYYHPLFVAGNPAGYREAVILAVTPMPIRRLDSQQDSDDDNDDDDQNVEYFPLELDNGEVLPSDTRVRRLVTGRERPIEDFVLIEGTSRRTLSTGITGIQRQAERMRQVLQSTKQAMSVVPEHLQDLNQFRGRADAGSSSSESSESDTEFPQKAQERKNSAKNTQNNNRHGNEKASKESPSLTPQHADLLLRDDDSSSSSDSDNADMQRRDSALRQHEQAIASCAVVQSSVLGSKKRLQSTTPSATRPDSRQRLATARDNDVGYYDDDDEDSDNSSVEAPTLVPTPYSSRKGKNQQQVSGSQSLSVTGTGLQPNRLNLSNKKRRSPSSSSTLPLSTCAHASADKALNTANLKDDSTTPQDPMPTTHLFSLSRASNPRQKTATITTKPTLSGNEVPQTTTRNASDNTDPLVDQLASETTKQKGPPGVRGSPLSLGGSKEKKNAPPPPDAEYDTTRFSVQREKSSSSVPSNRPLLSSSKVNQSSARKTPAPKQRDRSMQKKDTTNLGRLVSSQGSRGSKKTDKLPGIIEENTSVLPLSQLSSPPTSPVRENRETDYTGSEPSLLLSRKMTTGQKKKPAATSSSDRTKLPGRDERLLLSETKPSKRSASLSTERMLWADDLDSENHENSAWDKNVTDGKSNRPHQHRPVERNPLIDLSSDSSSDEMGAASKETKKKRKSSFGGRAEAKRRNFDLPGTVGEDHFESFSLDTALSDDDYISGHGMRVKSHIPETNRQQEQGSINNGRSKITQPHKKSQSSVFRPTNLETSDQHVYGTLDSSSDDDGEFEHEDWTKRKRRPALSQRRPGRGNSGGASVDSSIRTGSQNSHRHQHSTRGDRARGSSTEKTLKKLVRMDKKKRKRSSSIGVVASNNKKPGGLMQLEMKTVPRSSWLDDDDLF